MADKALLDTVIRNIELDAVSYDEGKTHFTIKCSNGSMVMVSKELVWSKYESYKNGGETDYQRKYRQSHTHKGGTQECWECGRVFCYRCKFPEASWDEAYCGC